MLPRMIERDCWRQRQSFFARDKKENNFIDWRSNNHIVLGPKYQQILAATRSSWLNCALRDDEAVYWVSIALQRLGFGGTESAYWRFQFVIDGKWPV